MTAAILAGRPRARLRRGFCLLLVRSPKNDQNRSTGTLAALALGRNDPGFVSTPEREATW